MARFDRANASDLIADASDSIADGAIYFIAQAFADASICFGFYSFPKETNTKKIKCTLKVSQFVF